MHCKLPPFLNIGIILASLRASGNIPVSKERLISFSIGILISLKNCFKSLVGMLLGPIDLRMFRVLIMSSISSVFVSARMKLFVEAQSDNLCNVL